MNEKRLCLNCGYELQGRSDQKYCSDLCRNAFNNHLNSDSNNFVRNVNNVLRRNKRILEKLCPQNKSKTTRALLAMDGFNFNYHTNVFKTKKGIEYIFCYDYGYLQLLNDEIVIVKRKDYVE